MKLIFYSPVLLLFLCSCQIPAALPTSPLPSNAATAVDSSEPWLPKKTIVVGLNSPTWDLAKKLAAESIGQESIDDTYTRIKTSRKVLAITFDDGPHPTNTPRLLDILKEKKVRATFFVVGDMIRRHPDNPAILRRMITEGHEIGNHTATHKTLSRMSDTKLREELTPAHQEILAATGVPPRVMRPPSGVITAAQKRLILKEYGYPQILWSVDPRDWQRPGAAVVTRRLIEGASPGGILLVHDLHSASVDAVPAALDALLAQEYEFVTVSELIAIELDAKEKQNKQ